MNWWVVAALGVGLTLPLVLTVRNNPGAPQRRSADDRGTVTLPSLRLPVATEIASADDGALTEAVDRLLADVSREMTAHDDW